MREDLVREYASKLGIDNFKRKSSRGWLEAPCPLAPWTHDKGHDTHPSFAIKVNEEGKSSYACQQCHHSGTLAKLAYELFGFTQDVKYQQLGYQIEADEIAGIAASLPEWDDETEEDRQESARVFLDRAEEYAKYPLATDSPRAVIYCRNRGITPYTMMRMGLRYHYAEDRVLFPVFDRNQELRGFVGRAMNDEDELRVKDYGGLNKRELLLGEHYLFKNRHKIKYVVGAEGPFDRAKILQARHPSFALLGSTLTPEKMKLLIDLDRPIIWMVDNDHGGEDFLFGITDKETGERIKERGALHRLAPYVPQFTVTYPRFAHLPKKKRPKDPGALSTPTINRMIRKAEMWIDD